MHRTIQKLQGIPVEEAIGQRDALFFHRQEYKYIFPAHLFSEILDYFQADYLYSYSEDGFIYEYHNTYFDTVDHHLFHMHRQGKYNRLKFRIRRYRNGVCNSFLECKRKVKGKYTRKERVQVASDFFIGQHNSIEEDYILSELNRFHFNKHDLLPVLDLQYHRINLLSQDRTTRITFDFNVTAQSSAGVEFKLLPGHMVMEIKTAQFPKAIKKFLRRNLNLREARFSKYCVALAYLEDLRRNKWKRIFKNYH